MSNSVLTNIANLSPEKRKLLELLLKDEGIELQRSLILPQTRDSNRFPLSFAQQRLWFIDQFMPGSSVYNVPAVVRLQGELDLAVLQRVLNTIVQRHETLRTTFTTVAGQPVQVIAPELHLEVPRIDLRHLDAVECAAEVDRLTEEAAHQPFDLAHGPLLRTRLLQLADDAYIFLLTMHHICSDGWSREVLIGEMATLYQAFVSGQPSPLPELTIQYADFAVWQRQWLQGERLEQQLAYWKQQLGEHPTALQLPNDYPRPVNRTFQGATRSRQLPAALLAAIAGVGQLEQATLFMTLLAAFQVLLYRYSGQEDICVGTPIANRTRVELEPLIGFFVNTLVMRADLSANPSFRTLVQRVRETTVAAYAHQDVPFEMLVEVLQPERSLSYSPLFQVMFVVQNATPGTQELAGLTLSPVESNPGGALFDLTLYVVTSPAAPELLLEYSTDLFDDATIARMLEHFQVLLEGIAANPDQPIATLPLLSDQERQQVLVEWNATATPYPRDLTIPQLFAAQVARTPAAIALVFAGQHMTYHDLNARANQLAHYLQRLGVGPETLVGLCMERSCELIIGLLAILKAGGAYVAFEPTTPTERLAWLLADTNVPVLLTQAHLREHLPPTPAHVLCLDQANPALAQASTTNPPCAATPTSLAYVAYTSGSTGTPKGVCIPHRAVVRLVTQPNYADLSADAVLLQLAPIPFDASTLEIWGSLLNGARLVIMPPHPPSLADLAQVLETERVSLLWLTAGLFHLMVDAHLERLAQVRQVLAGGDVLSVAHVVRLLQAKTAGTLINGYGPTENTTFSCCYPMTDPAQVGPTVPIGRPIANSQAYILDPLLQPVPIGVVGELYVGGDGLARGYLNRPDLTAEKFIPPPFADDPAARLYRTGDLARYLPDGTIEFLGRMDHQVKLRGFRIELGEIEVVLAQHPAVREVVVLAREELPGQKYLAAYVVPHHAMPAGADPAALVRELRAFLEQKLPDYMVPAAFVPLEALPLNANGKVDRRALPVPAGTSPAEDDYIPPTSSEEVLLAEIWMQVLNVKRVSIHDDFFHLGGHSLMAIQAASRIRDVFGIELPVRSIFEHAVLYDLAHEIARVRRGADARSAPLLPAPRDAALPLSFSQQRLWFLEQLEPDSPLYNIPVVARLTGRLDVAVLERSLNEIVQRHEVLRTSFLNVDGQPIQVIAPSVHIPLPLVELQALPAAIRATEVQRLAAAETQQPFDLAQGPLLRARLLRLAPTEHIFLLTLHHIVTDNWSMSIFIQELDTFYTAMLADAPADLPDLPIQYADFAHWQRQWLQGTLLDQQLAYWKQQLGDTPPVLELPTDRPRRAIRNFQGDTRSFLLPPRLLAALHQLSQQEGATLFMTLLAAFKVLLHRYSGQTDITVGTPIANRTQAAIEPLIGFFLNTLVLRTDLAAAPGFREVLRRVRRVALAAYDHADLPFEMLVEALQPERDMSHSPLFQVMFVLHNAAASFQNLAGLNLEPVEIQSGIARFDLTLILAEESAGLRGTVEYTTDLFDAATITRMIEHFQILLEAIVANPDQAIASLPLLSEQERHQVLVGWNATAVPYPTDVCLHHLIADQVARTPTAPALLYEDQILSFQELDQRTNQLAHHLQRLGVGPDVPVTVCAERSFEMVIALVAILKAGGAYVPLDPAYPAERLAFILADCQAPVLLTQQHLAALLPPHGATVRCLDRDWDQIAQEPSTPPTNLANAEHLAYIIYTSGSTGQPKGALINHRAIVNRLLWMQDMYHLTPADRVLQKTPFSFDVSVWEFFWPLLTGAGLVIARPEGHKDSAYLVDLIQRAQITTLHFVPPMLQVFLEEPDVPACRSLRRIICSGEALPYDLQERCFARLPHVELHNLYGPTEAAVDVSYWACERGSSRQLVPIGFPVANTQLYVLDALLQPVPIGVPGELHIGGVQLARGYLNRSELTAEKFIHDPFSPDPAARLYKTGDLARFLRDGAIEYLGRLDHQVKLRGFRIELGEIEAVLAQHPAVREVVVLAREETPGQKYLAAYLVPHSSGDARSDPAALVPAVRALLQAKLPEYMLPAAFVVLEALPLTPNGKVNRRALPVPDTTQTRAAVAYVAPRNPTEALLAEMWADLLNLPQVGIYDNFFELGGHSLLATRLAARIRSTFQVELPLRSLFEQATIAALAPQIELAQREARGVVAPPLLPVARTGERPLSFAQQRLWFLDQIEPNSPVYNIPIALQLQGTLDTTALERSINLVVERHEMLRTTFSTLDGQPIQVIIPELRLPLPLIDLQHLPPAARQAEVQRLARAEARHPFDLVEGPLLRVKLVRLAIDDHVVLLTIHHIITDAWSMALLVQELAAIYPSCVAGLPSPLAPLPLQYADFAHWQRQWLQGKVLEQQLGYWMQQLAGLPTALALPTARPRPAVQNFQGVHQFFTVPAAVAAGLRALSQQTGTTLFMTLLAAFQTLLFRYSGQDDICVGSPIANRTHAEVEGLIGFFVNTLVLRTSLAGEPGFRELLARVREVTLGAYTHQDTPFELLVDALQPERDLSRTPLFQVMFALQNVQNVTPQTRAIVPELTLQPIEVESGSARFDLTLVMDEDADGLQGSLEYATDLFDAATITRMIAHFQTLLAAIVANPDQPITRLSFMTEAERQQVLFDWNPANSAYPADRCLHHWFEAQVDQTPDAIAVSFEGVSLTYRDLNRRANQLAHALRKRGVAAGTLVGLCVERSTELVIGILGILKAGGAYVPLDPAYPTERLAFMREDARLALVLTQQSVANRPCDAVETQQMDIAVVYLDTGWAQIAQEADTNPDGNVTPANLAYVIYTSGSTGKPKGVQVTHANVTRLFTATDPWYRFNQRDVWSLFHSYAFDFSVWELWGALLYGGRLVVVPYWVSRSPEAFYDLLLNEQVTVLNQTPSAFRQLIQADAAAIASASPAPLALRLVIFGGEALELQSLRPWFERHGDLPQLVNMYGITETTVHVTYRPLRLADLDTAPGSVIGRPIPDLQVYILDQYLQPVPVGVPGELCVGGAGVASGYLNRPALTAERFIADPFHPHPEARLYRSGDLARFLPDGDIAYLGRIDQQVKIRGFRIELGEIEAVLNQHPSVRESVVLLREDRPGARRLVAYVVASSPPAGADATGEAQPERASAGLSSQLRAFVQAQLPDYMIPSAFVQLPALPLTTNGKVDRRVLPVPESERPDLEATYTAPVSQVEATLARIWGEVLGLEQVGVHDNFFELGGDSILTIQIIARANQAGLRLTPRQLFQFPTIAELATMADSAQPINAEQGVVTGPVPLLPIQHWFFAQQQPEPHHWNQALLLETTLALEPALLETVVQHLCHHHDALRMRFTHNATGWEQVNADIDEPVSVTWIDLAHLTEPTQAATIEQMATELQASLNLSAGPLLRVAYFDRGAGRSGRLLLIIHHLVIDGVSWRIILEDLERVYQQLQRGEAVRLPPKTSSYRAWAHRLVEYAHAETLQREAQFWRDLAQSHLPCLPRDLPDGLNTEASAHSLTYSLSSTETQALLHNLPARYRAEMNDALLAALALALRAWSGSPSILINLEGHGREDIFEDIDLSRTVGWFTTIFPVAVDLTGVEEPAAVLLWVKEQLRRIPNRGIGYGILRYLAAEPSLNGQLHPLSQAEVSFNYLGQIDRAIPADAAFRFAPEAHGPERSPQGWRNHLLDITGSVVAGVLQVEWVYSSNIHHAATIERVAHDFMAALRAIITHAQTAEAVNYTPSDFAEFGWDAQDLEGILAEIKQLD